MKLTAVLLFGAMVIPAITTAYAQPSSSAGQRVADIGMRDYEDHCAVCHGFSGKGDGVFANLLKPSINVPNLTQLSKNNHGVYPFTRVYEIIDGTMVLQAHGTKDMPIWGPRFGAEAGERFYDNIFGIESKAIVRARILALTEYIFTLQVK